MRKKILYLVTKSSWHGAQRYVYDLATALPETEYAVKVATGGHGPLVTKLKAANMAVVEVPGLQRDVSLTKEIMASWQIMKVIRQEKPDLLHVNSSKAGVIGAFIGRLLRVPRIIFTSHGWAFNEDRPYYQKFIFKLAHWLTVLLSHQTIAVSRAVKDQMDWPFAYPKITVVHNGRAIKNLMSKAEARTRLAEVKPELKNYLDDFWSVTNGELHPTKRHDLVIKAIDQVVKLEPKVRHLIISDGQEKAELELLIRKLQLEQNVFLMGHLDEAAQYLRAFDLFVLASDTEALGYVIIEAAMAKLPIITSRVGGIPEVVTDQKSALFFAAGDLATLTSHYNKLLSDEALRQKLAEAAKERSQNFTFEAMLQRTLAVYSADKTTSSPW